MKLTSATVAGHSHLVNTCQYFFIYHLHQSTSPKPGQYSQNQTASEVTPDPFFCQHKEKWKKAVWSSKVRYGHEIFSRNYPFIKSGLI